MSIRRSLLAFMNFMNEWSFLNMQKLWIHLALNLEQFYKKIHFTIYSALTFMRERLNKFPISYEILMTFTSEQKHKSMRELFTGTWKSDCLSTSKCAIDIFIFSLLSPLFFIPQFLYQWKRKVTVITHNSHLLIGTSRHFEFSMWSWFTPDTEKSSIHFEEFRSSWWWKKFTYTFSHGPTPMATLLFTRR